MGARLTFGLVALAALTLAVGYVTHTPWLIYISIVCSVLAAAGLLFSPRRKRRAAKEKEESSWPASLAEPSITRTEPVRVFTPDPTEAPAGAGLRIGPGSSTPRRRPAPPVVAAPSEDDDPFAFPEPAPTQAVRRRPTPVAAVVPDDLDEPEELDHPDEPRVYRLPSTTRSPKKNPVAADWVHADEPVAQPAYATPVPRRPAASATPVARRAAPVARPASPVARPAASPAAPAAPTARPAAPAAPPRSPAPVQPATDYPFPIEDYDYLGVAEILPLLPELDDTELVEVLLYEQKNANRVGILNRIDALLEGEG